MSITSVSFSNAFVPGDSLEEFEQELNFASRFAGGKDKRYLWGFLDLGVKSRVDSNI